MPTIRQQFAAVAASEVRIYTIGGWAYYGGNDPTVEKLNPLTNSWTMLAPLPVAEGGINAAIVGGKIYVTGGNTNILWVYDALEDTWTQGPPIPTSRSGPGVVEVGGKLYVVGGYTTAVEVYDPETNAWEARSPMPTYKTCFAVAAVGGKIYVIGGQIYHSSTNQYEYLHSVDIYDPSSDTWGTGAPMPTGRSSLGAAAAGNGRIYAVGGHNEVNGNLSTVEEYDPVANTWATKSPISRARFDVRVVATGNKIYALGGGDGMKLGIVDEGAISP